jgi:type II secretion system protein C
MFYAKLSRALRFVNPLLMLFSLLSIFYLIRVLIEPAVPLIPEQRSEVRGQKSELKETLSLAVDKYAGLLQENPFGIKGEFRLINQQSGVRGNSGEKEGLITLIGTVSGGDYDYAIVVDQSGKQEVFKKGQNIFGIGKLKAVYKDRIVLKTPSGERSYEIADIIIKEVKAQAGAVSSSSPAITPLSAPVKTSGNIFTINSDALRHAIDNPKEILTDARFIPNIVDGRQEGFIVKELKKGGVYESLGLEDGDVLLRVNNLPITGPESALQAFTALKGMDRIELDIMRRGQKITMTYQIR